MINQEEQDTGIDFIPIKDFKGKTYLVQDYQRGYKWGKLEINALLNDIEEHEGGQYCLQPLIVKTLENGIEVIDGQQRITSIYLILHYLDKNQFYQLEYNTREATKSFLQNQLNQLKEFIKGDNNSWNDFINEEAFTGFNNVDVFHIFEVYKNIHNWFSNKTPEDKNQFCNKLLNEVSIIWYAVDQKEANSAEDVFLNLNAGKVPLTNSELIKALFILDKQRRHSENIATLKAFELANEWDQIENQLQDPSFFFFICDHPYYEKLDTRIDIIIDLATGNTPGKKWDPKGSYREYERKFKDKEHLDWEHIKQTFNKVSEWYSDHENKELYHYIGFLINTHTKSLGQILKLSKGKSKVEFNNSLFKKIKKKLEIKKKVEGNETEKEFVYNLDNLNYEKSKKECNEILLLLNLEFFIRDASSNKFPFELYKKEKWSVEHINPQNRKN